MATPHYSLQLLPALPTPSYSFFNTLFLPSFPPSLPPAGSQLYSPGYPGTHYVNQANLKLTEISLLLLPVLGLNAYAGTFGL